MNWWNSNYQFRKKLTIAAPVSNTVPVGYPVIVSVNTASLQSLGKLRSDRKDWKICYWNGSSWVVLVRHYITTTQTIFAVQASIPANSSDSNYYLYYGNPNETVSSDPASNSDWNNVYSPLVEVSTEFLIHAKEGTGSTANDTSGNGMNGSLGSGVGWTDTSTKFGYELTFPNSAGAYVEIPSFDCDAFTAECFIKKLDTVDGLFFNHRVDTSKWQAFFANGNNSINVLLQGNSGTPSITTSSPVITDTNEHHLAISFDGTNQVYIYLDGTLFQNLDFSGSGQTLIRGGGSRFRFGEQFNGQMSHMRFRTAQISSFPYGFSAAVTVTPGNEDVLGGGAAAIAVI